MRAIVQTGANSVEVQERERPSPADDEALVRVHSAGLCGSDAHAYQYEGGYEWVALPRIMGHEYSGEVVEVGREVTSVEPGDEVVEEPVHDCGDCFQCKNGQANVCRNVSISGMHCDGGYADFVAVDAGHLHRVPDEVQLAHAGLTEPTSVAARAVFTRSNVQAGQTVLVEGPGPIGVLVASIADSIGANVLVSGLETDAEYRLPLVDELGIDTVDAQTADLAAERDDFTDGYGFDAVFDTTGHHSGIETAVEQVRRGGEVVIVGLPGDPSELSVAPIVRGEMVLNTSYGSTWRNFEQALGLMRTRSIDFDAIADTSYDVSDPETAFEAFLRSETCKPVFRFGG